MPWWENPAIITDWQTAPQLEPALLFACDFNSDRRNWAQYAMYDQIVRLGKYVSDGFRGVGEIAILLWQCIAWLARGIPYKRETIQQFYFIGVQSIPVILFFFYVTGSFVFYT
ncbi:MAG: hypothetical protein LIQ31_15005, partial [Planctomycetes bacterium]|nr:hypothetical protein [Planctomycetota bacterium]